MVGSDENVAKAATPKPILFLAEQTHGIPADCLEPYGRFKAKIPFSYLDSLDPNKQGKLVLVTAMSPTKAGEGKTTVSVGLADALNHIGKQSMVALREPSLGPVFGMKGGAAGGGYAQVIPMADINLHFTGDLHAIGAAHNLLSAMVDNHIYWQKAPLLDSRKVTWRRVIDMNDRSLRSITIGGGGGGLNGYLREDGFDITVASEVMAIFCLSTSPQDLQRRLSNIIVGYTRNNDPVTAKNLNADGAMAALLRDALQPNLVQTLEGNLAIIHGGPFANIAHGCSSVIATQAALKMADYVITEAGFGADLGAQKFLDIKCRKTGLVPSVVVMVATVRALKLHGGIPQAELGQECVSAVKAGLSNLRRHIENTQGYGLEVVVAINAFIHDTELELQLIQDECASMGVRAVVSNHWSNGGAGAVELAATVIDTIERQEQPPTLHLLYPDTMPLLDKIRTIAQRIYKASDITINAKAAKELKRIENMGYGHYPVCIAKTQYSFSCDENLKGAPSDHVMPISEVRLCAGAEFVVVLTGSVMTMPGLSKVPSAENVGIDENGQICGLF